jgi:NAD-dependent deacetylase
VASLTALHRTPVEFYQFYRHRLARLAGALPNPAHFALAALQRAGLVKTIITQNIDGLHQAAGATDVIECHGNLREAACLDCRAIFPADILDREVLSLDDVPRCPKCSGTVKPNVILFEEPLPRAAFDRAWDEARRSDLFMVVGSSLEVGPVNMLPQLALQGGARLAICNLSSTGMDPFAEWLIAEKAGIALPALAEAVGAPRGE